MSKIGLKDYYDNLYQDNPNIFGNSSLIFLKKILHSCTFNDGRALDIGPGNGLTSQYLADVGFIVDAVDLSSNAFAAVTDFDHIKTHIIPIEDFKVKFKYDLILFALTAHHLTYNDFHKVIAVLQKNTKTSGLNCFRIFTSDSDFYRQSDKTFFYDDGDSLDLLYKDWQVIEDKLILAQASTSSAKNEIREVVYRKKY